MEMVEFTLIPMSCAAPLSSDTARMAVPVLVFVVNSVSAVIMTIQARTVTIVTPDMVSCPSKSFKDQFPTTEEKVLGLEPQMRRAAFCKK